MKKKILAILSILIAFLASVSALAMMSAAAGPAGQVYTIDNAASGNNVLVFNRGSDGSLVASGTYSTSGLGTGSKLASQGAVVLSQDGKWLLVVDAGSNQISVFEIEGNTLTLTDIESSQGMTPISLTIEINVRGNYVNPIDLVYVLNNGSATVTGNIAGFWLDGFGKLTYITGSNQPVSAPNCSPEQIGFVASNPYGNVLVVTEKATGIIDTYTVNNNGVASAPMMTASNSPGPYGFAFNSKGYLIVSEAAANTLSSYYVNNDGSLRTLSGSLPTFGNAPCWVATTGDGKFAYTTNAHGGTISGFTISNTGQLSLFSSIAATVNIPALDLAFSALSKFLYVLNGNSITGFQVYNDGSLASVTTVNSLPGSATGLAAT
jgi:6-phosphogluconolactonase (cycloisomerase 2 family)